MSQWLISLSSILLTSITSISVFSWFDMDSVIFLASYAVTMPLYVFYNTCMQIQIYIWKKSK